MQDCIFCQIAQGQSTASRVYEDEHTLAFMDIQQATEGHVLVIPKRHVANLFELDAETTAQLFQSVVLVARAVRASLQPAGLNLWQANGRAAGQSVFHVHVHILPRYEGDGFRVSVHEGSRRATRTELDELAARIRAKVDVRA